ncbi:MAG: hypothetical protein ACI398_04500 [Clostridium sp.]
MDYDEINEFIKKYALNYNYKNSNNSKTEDNNSNNKENNDEFNYGFFYTNKNGYGCNDMPGGFQRINPLLFIIIGQILGDAAAGRMPFNVQNAVGNWIQLVGQAIETYSSQQSYFQSGPGRYYNPENLNITNTLCPSESTSSTSNQNQSDLNSSNNMEDIEGIIQGLYAVVKELRNELDTTQKEISSIKKDINKNDSNITE